MGVPAQTLKCCACGRPPAYPRKGKPPLTFDEWISHGITEGWAGPPVCSTHDGTPTSAAEDDDFYAGHDPCIHIIRLYPDHTTRDAVETNHTPSQWRKP